MPGPNDWWNDPAARWLIERTRVPIAAVDADGVVHANEAFLASVKTAPEELKRALQDATSSPEGSVVVAGAPARVFRSGEQVLLVLERDLNDEVDALRARVDELEHKSATDPLTGAWNRGHLDAVIPAEIARSERYRSPLTLILGDLDHFKRINDTHGHAVGDLVLRDVVTTARRTVRSADLLFRWGGEEFAILAVSTGYRGAATVAESLRAAIEAHDFPDVGRVTMSLGVAEHVPGEEPLTWFKRVDAALYAAKHGGRNRVSVDRQGSSDRWAASSGRAALSLTWVEAYESGQPTIDAQHRELFALANAAIVAATGNELQPLLVALDALNAHVELHFRTEEQILADAGYDGLDQHRLEHATLLQRAVTLRQGVAEGGLTFARTVDFLANAVVAHHVFGSDRKFFHLFGGASS